MLRLLKVINNAKDNKDFMFGVNFNYFMSGHSVCCGE